MSIFALLAAAAGSGTPVDPDPPVENDGFAIGTSSDPVWVPEGSLTRWRAARDNATNELVEVAFMGDSTSYGQAGAGPGDSGLAGRSYPSVYWIRDLAAAAGLPSGGLGHYSRSNTDIPIQMGYNWLASRTGGTSHIAGYGDQVLNTYHLSAPGDQVTWNGEGRYARLMVARNGQLVGNFTYAADGGATLGTVPTGTDPDGYDHLTVDLDTDAAHTLTLSALGGDPTAPPPISHATTGASGGTLAPGTYYYVGTHAPPTGGETTPSAERSVTVTAGQVVNVYFGKAVPNAGLTKIYRATTPGGPYAYVGERASSSNGPYSWTDDGSATPSGPPPAVSTAGPSGLNRVNVDVEWFDSLDSGIVWHLDAVSATQSVSGVVPYAAYRLNTRRTRLAVNVYGINDQQQIADRSTFLRDNLRTWVDMVRAAGASPVLCIPLYERANQKNTVDPGFTEPRSVRFRQIHRDVAIEKECALVDLGSGGALAGTEGWWGSVDPHLSPQMYQTQAEYLWHNLLKL